MINNKPKIKIGIVAVSRDCFPESLAVNRRKALVAAYTKKYGADEIYECPICIVESEIHMCQALEDMLFVFTLVTLVQKFLRLCLLSTLTVLRCSVLLQKRLLRTADLSRVVEMLTVVCSTLLTTSSSATSRLTFLNIL